MKRLFLVCTLLTVSLAPVMAQSGSAKTETAQQDPKVVFRNKIVELRNGKTAEAAMKSYMDLSDLMQKAIIANNDRISKSANADEKAKLEKVVLEQQAIYRDTKMMTREITKNQAEMAKMLDGFLQTI